MWSNCNTHAATRPCQSKEPCACRGMAVDALKVEADWIRLAAQGEWTQRGEQEVRVFNINVQGGELGKMLTAFAARATSPAVNQVLLTPIGRDRRAEFALPSWKAMWCYKSARADYSMSRPVPVACRTAQYLRTAAPVDLDFSDVFAKGFSFDSIAGNSNCWT